MCEHSLYTLSGEEIRAQSVCLYVNVGKNKNTTMATQSIFFSQLAFSQWSLLSVYQT